jgi:hypothetical protein
MGKYDRLINKLQSEFPDVDDAIDCCVEAAAAITALQAERYEALKDAKIEREKSSTWFQRLLQLGCEVDREGWRNAKADKLQAERDAANELSKREAERVCKLQAEVARLTEQLARYKPSEMSQTESDAYAEEGQ